MAQARPELIFLSGPQQGERATLMTDTAMLGRSASCEVCIKEPFASRQHVRFERTADGWVVEDISSTGTRINGKRYRSGKKIILDTGDVLGIGAETEILFVAPGADPEKALAEYRVTHPDAAGALVKAPAGEGQPAEAGAPGAAPLPVLQPAPGAAAAPATGAGARKIALGLDGPKTADLSLTDAEREAVRRRTAKVKKYAVIFGIYGILLVGLIILLQMRSGDGPGVSSGQPAYLDRARIREYLEAPIERSLNPVLAQKELKAAQDLAQRPDAEPGNLYWIVKNLKLYKAHKEGAAVFDNTEQSTMYQENLNKLLKTVCEKYDNAYAYERNRDWSGAIRLYEQLVRMLPDRQAGDPVYEKLFRNIMAHQTYCHKRSGGPR